MDRMLNYFKESYHELKDKVTWPTWKDLQTSAVIVLIASTIFALILLVMDMAAKNATNLFYDSF